MGRSYRKLGRRAIKKNMARFFSILIIVALGSGFLVGLMAAPWLMEDRTDAYLDQYGMYDISIKSTLGITEEDVDAIGEIDSVSSAIGAKTQEMIMEDNFQESHVVKLVDYPLENLELIEGRLPKAENEIVIELIDQYAGLNEEISTLTVTDNNKDLEQIEESLSNTEYKVVGLVESPYYISIDGDMSLSGQGRIVIGAFGTKEAFNDDDIYTDILVEVKGALGLNAFTEEYDLLIEEAMEDIERVGDQRSELRTEAIKEEALSKLVTPEEELEDAKISSLIDLAIGENSIATLEQTIEGEKQALEISNKALTDLDAFMASIMGTVSQETMMLLQLDREGIVSEIAIREEGIAQAEKELQKARNDLAYGKSIADSEITNAEKDIKTAEDEIKEIEAAEWIYFDRGDNSGISGYKSNIDKVRAVSAVFPIFFFAVTMLVALTTMSRMIEEERLQTGALKSLGYTNKNILGYYLIYSLTASIGGCIIGIGLGSTAFPIIIDLAYTMLYTLPVLTPKVLLWVAIPVALVILFSVALSAYLSCKGELKEKPARLLIPKAPKMGKRIFLERIKPLWSRTKFSHKVTLRNIFRYKKRLLMTIIGIAGSFALLLTGFGLRDSIGDTVDIQYADLYKYDMVAKVSEEKWIEEDVELKAILDDKSFIADYGEFQNQSVTIVGKDDEDITGDLIVAKDDEDMTKYYNFQTRILGKEVEFSSNSLIITEKMSEELSVGIGDTVEIHLGNGESEQVAITGICENYVGHAAYLSRDTYEMLYHTETDFSTVIGKVNYNSGATDEEVLDAVLETEHIDYMIMASDVKQTFAESVKSINYIVIMIMVCAGALVMVVLYNLININICERKKELATIEVLGFYNKEVYSYIFRETNLLCLIGVLIGVPVGIALHRFVVHVAEIEGIMFGREISLLSYAFSFLLTIVFVILVNRIMRKGIKKINMVESMKAND